jgi:long-chain acyl-CoA synthetase
MNNNNTISKMFLSRTQQDPNKNAIGWITNNILKFINYSTYQHLVESISLGLINNGLSKNDKVAIILHTKVKWHLIDLGIMCSNATVIPISPDLATEDIIYILKHSEAKIAFVENDNEIEKLSKYKSELNLLETFISIKKLPNTNQETHFKLLSYRELITHGNKFVTTNPKLFLENINNQLPDNIASIIYTSGTTGRPKGAVIKHSAFIQMFKNVKSAFTGIFTEHDTILTFLPLSHIMGRMDSLLIIPFGNINIYSESRERLMSDFKIARPTVFLGVPRIFEKIYTEVINQINEKGIIGQILFNLSEKISSSYFTKLTEEKTPDINEIIKRKIVYNFTFKKINNAFGGRIKFFLSGGNSLSDTIIQFFQNANIPILEGYGLTETLAPCSVNPIHNQIIGSVGIPIGDVQIQINKQSEILIKTKSIFTEYYKDINFTNKSLQDEWLHTGDLGYINNQGHLIIIDRLDNMIKLNNQSIISPQSIENKITISRYISHCMVIGNNQNFLTCVIGIEKINFLQLMAKMKIDRTTDIKIMSKHPDIKELIKNEIINVNKTLIESNKINSLFIAPEEFTINKGYLTPSLKLRRQEIYNKYIKEIKAMHK